MQRAAVVCHDAGGAEVVSNWIADLRDFRFSTLLKGPAVGIFSENLHDFNYPMSDNFDQLSAQCDWLLCGTSWQSSLELDAIKRFRYEGKKTVAFLDHWANYQERFQDGDAVVLPDEIWVGDEHARRMASDQFHDTPVINVGNSYLTKFENQLAEVAENACAKNNVCLYVCEPIKEHALLKHGDSRYLGYTEDEALEYFLANLRHVSTDIDTIIIRPHPSEKADKYSWVVKKYGHLVNIKIGGNKSITYEICNSELVVGCESMAMVLGVIANKTVISSIPPGGKPCCLPHQEIKTLQHILTTSHAAKT